MSRELAETRAARDAARAAFDSRLYHLRGDPEAETIGERVIGRVGEDAQRSMLRAVEVAAESKGIAAATAALLALWFLRGPILAWIDGLWRGGETDEEHQDA